MKGIKLKPAHFVVFGVILGLGGFFFLLANPFGLKTPTPFIQNGQKTSPAGTLPPGVIYAPTPTLILPTGRQTFNVQGGDQDFSKITRIVVDPLNAQKGVQQTLEISVNSVEPVTSFVITLKTDGQTNTYAPTLISGDATNGLWQVTYAFPDTATGIYNFVFDMTTNTNKKTSIPFPVR